MPGMDGVTTTKKMRELLPGCPGHCPHQLSRGRAGTRRAAGWGHRLPAQRRQRDSPGRCRARRSSRATDAGAGSDPGTDSRRSESAGPGSGIHRARARCAKRLMVQGMSNAEIAGGPGGEHLDRQVSRQQHSRQAWRGQPYRGSGAGLTGAAGVTAEQLSLAGRPRRAYPGGV
jgi:hypothetical protein